MPAITPSSYSPSSSYTGTAGTADAGGTKDRAVLLVGKAPFDPGSVTVGVTVTGDGASDRSAEIFRNSKYSKFDVSVADTWRVELIAPCSQRDVDKYSAQTFSFIRETPAVYAAVTLPYIEAIPASAIEWVRGRWKALWGIPPGFWFGRVQ